MRTSSSLLFFILLSTPLLLFPQECKESQECREICHKHDELSLEGCLKLCTKLSCSAPVDDWVIPSPTPQPTSSQDWTIHTPSATSSSEPHIDDFTFDPKTRPCTPELASSCKDSCRFKFGDAFHSCTETCLSHRCGTPPSGTPTKDPVDGPFCLEVESETCVSQCKDGTLATQARCRRSCLEGRCPSASRSDAAREGLNPGTIECERCNTESLKECEALCAVPSTSHDPVRYGALGCLKICQASKCFKPCN